MGLLDRLRGRPDAQPLPPPTYSNDSVIGRIVEEEGVRDYEAYCTERFGRLVHHQPAGEPDEHAYGRAYRERAAYRSSAGADPMIWAIPAGVSGSDSRDEDRDREKDGSSSGGAAAGGSAGAADEREGSGHGDAGGDSGGGDSGGSSCGGSSCGGSSCGGGGS